MTEQTNTHTHTHARHADQAILIGAELIDKVHELCGGPRTATLAGLHAYLVTELAALMGGTAAAALCENAANRIRHLPPMPMDGLATAQPMGSA